MGWRLRMARQGYDTLREKIKASPIGQAAEERSRQREEYERGKREGRLARAKAEGYRAGRGEIRHHAPRRPAGGQRAPARHAGVESLFDIANFGSSEWLRAPAKKRRRKR